MKRSSSKKSWKSRRGIIAVLSAVLFIVMLAMVAFAVDVGYMGMVQTQLQTAADSAALAAAGSSNLSQDGMAQVAQAFAQYHQVAGRSVVLNSGDVQFGTWDPDTKTFAAVTTGAMGTAVKVTVKVDPEHGGSAGLFFGRVLGVNSVDTQASAVAMVNPRDICFVVDLSSSMNDDSMPGSIIRSHDYLIQAVYNDVFGYAADGSAKVTYNPRESSSSISGNSITKKMNNLKSDYPKVVPLPDTASPASVQYWTDVLGAMNNYFSYKSYVTFLQSHGRDQPLVDGTQRYSIMSTKNSSYLRHTESVGGTPFDQFPASEMPTHAVRRAIIAAIQIIQERNALISDADHKDRVSIVTFDRKNNPPSDTDNVVVLKSLTDDYTEAMKAAAKLQACGGSGVCTDSEGGLIVAYNHIKPESLGGSGREHANKVIVFLTDGNANLYESPDDTIDDYKDAHPGGWGDNRSENAALMQAQTMQGDNWYVFAVGVGLSGDQTFMNKMAVKGGTAIDGAAYPIADDAATYETTLRDIFNKIISNPKLRLVQ